MTWNTPRGERVLEGSEAKLFAKGLLKLVDIDVALTDEDYGDEEYGEVLSEGNLAPGPFHRLAPHQKWRVMEEVAVHLLTPTPEPLPLDAIHENAVYYVYQWILHKFEDEDDVYAEEDWGDLVLGAVESDIAAGEAGSDFWPTVGCMDY